MYRAAMPNPRSRKAPSPGDNGKASPRGERQSGAANRSRPEMGSTATGTTTKRKTERLLWAADRHGLATSFLSWPKAQSCLYTFL